MFFGIQVQTDYCLITTFPTYTIFSFLGYTACSKPHPYCTCTLPKLYKQFVSTQRHMCTELAFLRKNKKHHLIFLFLFRPGFLLHFCWVYPALSELLPSINEQWFVTFCFTWHLVRYSYFYVYSKISAFILNHQCASMKWNESVCCWLCVGCVLSMGRFVMSFGSWHYTLQVIYNRNYISDIAPPLLECNHICSDHGFLK